MWSWIADHIFGIAAAVGGFGVLAVLALIFVVGVPAALLLTQVVGFFKELVKFFQTTQGAVVGALLLIIAVGFVVDTHRTRERDGYWRGQIIAMQRKAEADRKARDAQIKAQVEADADKRIGSLDKLRQQLQDQVDDYEQKLRARPETVAPVAGKCPNVCRANSDDVKFDSRRRVR